jgi:hypothetical protein
MKVNIDKTKSLKEYIMKTRTLILILTVVAFVLQASATEKAISKQPTKMEIQSSWW